MKPAFLLRKINLNKLITPDFIWIILALCIGELCFGINPLQAQDVERKPGFLMGSGIGISNVETEIGNQDIDGNGPAQTFFK